jgi:hypothetical protein
LAISKNLKLEHQEERVRNRHRRSYICVAFVLASSFSLLAQSNRIAAQRRDTFQLEGDPARPVLTAKLDEPSAIGGASNESELPDAPSATTPDSSNTDGTASPAVKRDSVHGAPPAATGGRMGVDRSVADRNYLLVTGGMFGTSIVNAELTVRCLDKHPSCNDVPSSFQSRAAIYGIGIPADLGVAYLTYYMKKKHSHMWYVPAALVSGANIFLAVRAHNWTQQLQ